MSQETERVEVPEMNLNSIELVEDAKGRVRCGKVKVYFEAGHAQRAIDELMLVRNTIVGMIARGDIRTA